jgi:hypothetical protein
MLPALGIKWIIELKLEVNPIYIKNFLTNLGALDKLGNVKMEKHKKSLRR